MEERMSKPNQQAQSKEDERAKWRNKSLKDATARKTQINDDRGDCKHYMNGNSLFNSFVKIC
ncbi:hypothetical protein M5K25_011982 [Dendrobium thyrsiflorum]|uniref:Uncharacterized protein n=1 Tax=Dendrobium thyrsiflorum TaxID=117978 RepID=A0ABD0VBN2_DENTH